MHLYAVKNDIKNYFRKVYSRLQDQRYLSILRMHVRQPCMDIVIYIHRYILSIDIDIHPWRQLLDQLSV